MAKRQKKKRKKQKGFVESMGHWIFLIGVGLAIVLGIFMPGRSWIAGILAALGLVVGVINIKEKEHNQFLLAVVALVIASQAMSYVPVFGNVLSGIAGYLNVFVAIAAVMIALIVIWKLAKDR